VGADLGAGVNTPEDDAGVRRRRPYRHSHALAAMQTDTPAADRGSHRPLRRNPHVPQHVICTPNELTPAQNLPFGTGLSQITLCYGLLHLRRNPGHGIAGPANIDKLKAPQRGCGAFS
jgi:hypothetical protein